MSQRIRLIKTDPLDPRERNFRKAVSILRENNETGDHAQDFFDKLADLLEDHWNEVEAFTKEVEAGTKTIPEGTEKSMDDEFTHMGAIAHIAASIVVHEP